MNLRWNRDEDGLEQLLVFVNELDRRRVQYTLGSYSKDAIMVLIAVPGERWEVEFKKDRTVDVERFRSTGVVSGSEVIDELWRIAE